MTEAARDLPAPPIPVGAAFRGYEYVPMHHNRLRNSTFSAEASPEAFRAAFWLWMAAWEQVPAGSLPDNDKVLFTLSQYRGGFKRWSKLKAEVMHGWELHADGRLYHKAITEFVLQALKRQEADRERTRLARLAKLQNLLRNTTEPHRRVELQAEIRKLLDQAPLPAEPPAMPVDGDELEVELPSDWQPPEDMTARLRLAGLPPAADGALWQPAHVAAFVAHHRGKGSLLPLRRWPERFVSWMIHEKRYTERDAQRPARRNGAAGAAGHGLDSKDYQAPKGGRKAVGA